jgi:glycosyltransferase involved in cell wall biosynthesis
LSAREARRDAAHDTTVEHYAVARRSQLARWGVALRRFGSPRRLAATGRFAAGLAAEIRRRRAEPRLTVAVDVHALYETPTGVGWYLVRLLEGLARRDDLRLRLYAHGLIDSLEAPRPAVPLPAGPAIERVAYRAPDGLVVPPWRAHQILRRLAPLLAAADGNRVLFAPNYLLPPLFRLARGARIATVHDLAIRQVPWAVRPDSGAALERGLARTLLEADLILTPSEAVRGELAAQGVDPRRVRAIHHGPGHGPGAGRAPRGEGALPPGTPQRFVLHVGTLEPRKNVPLLLAAWRRLRERGIAAPPLVLAGGFGWRADELRRQVARAAAEGLLVHLGYVAPEELAALYRAAAAAVLPSFYEGFGLPLLEALAAGLPVVASDIPVHREVAGEAALYAPPDRPELFAAQVAALLADPGLRGRLAAAARERSALFSWERAAEDAARAFADADRGR